MKKKYMIVGITCIFLLISGVCYSCSFDKNNSSATLVTSLADGEAKTGVQSKEKRITEELNSKESNSQETSYKKDGFDDNASSSTLNLLETKATENTVSAENTNTNNNTDVYVHICGAVEKPGVYYATQGTRLFDMIALAGGLIKEAADDYINQAQIVTDGQRIYIPTKDEVKDISAAEYAIGENIESPQSSIAKVGMLDHATELVNINTANAEELMNLPGIGQAKAHSIINYRVTQGEFKTIEDIKCIPGIKEGLFGKISSLIVAK